MLREFSEWRSILYVLESRNVRHGGSEFVLTVVLGYIFWKKNLHRRFPAMGSYLALRVASAPVLFALLAFRGSPGAKALRTVFLHLLDRLRRQCVLLFFICMEVFRSALANFPGLMKFGIVIFRWAVLASVIMTFSSISFTHRGILSIPEIADALMRSVSILELCLLGFLCLSMNALRLRRAIWPSELHWDLE